MPKPFDLLQVYARFGADQRISLHDPLTRQAFAEHSAQEIERAMADGGLLNGQRAEAMFEALLVSLGEYRLFKADDNGQVFSDENIRATDFRVVLKDGEQWLIEVKNVYEQELEDQRLTLKADYLRSLQAYAHATGGVLKIAVFWARCQFWTLIDPTRFADTAGAVTLEMFACLKANELARLGDRTIGTRPPLRLVLEMDPERTGPIDAHGQVKMVIGQSRLFSGHDEIVEQSDKDLAWVFMMHGSWEEHGPDVHVEGDRLKAIEFRWEPTERANPDQEFEFIGSLSRMFSSYFAQHTVDDRQVVQLRAPMRPEWFAPLLQRDRPKGALPLWIFKLRPSYDEEADADRAINR